MNYYDKMTVSELIEALKNYPPDARVVVLGYESGYDDITLIKQVAILPEDNPSWFNGRYDDAPPEQAASAEKAVLLHGRNAEE
ncbi:MAG: hypothetical protein WBI04_06205 [Trichlorobacter sp.]|jgi:hypothetical protein